MRPIDADKLKADFWENVGDNAFFTLAVACRIIDRQETIDPDESPLFLEEIKAKIYKAGFKDGQRLRPQTEMHDAEEEKTEKKIEEIEYQNRKLRDKVYYQEGYTKGYMDGYVAHHRLVEERDDGR